MNPSNHSGNNLNYLKLPVPLDPSSLPFEKEDNIKLVSSFSNNIKNIVKNNIQKYEGGSGCIYKIQCIQCPKSYVGESVDLNRRMVQHRSDLRNSNQQSALVRHSHQFDHRLDLQGATILRNVNDAHARKLLESYYINTLDTFNEHNNSTMEFDYLSKNLIKKYVIKD